MVCWRNAKYCCEGIRKSGNKMYCLHRWTNTNTMQYTCFSIGNSVIKVRVWSINWAIYVCNCLRLDSINKFSTRLFPKRTNKSLKKFELCGGISMYAGAGIHFWNGSWWPTDRKLTLSPIQLISYGEGGHMVPPYIKRLEVESWWRKLVGYLREV